MCKQCTWSSGSFRKGFAYILVVDNKQRDNFLGFVDFPYQISCFDSISIMDSIYWSSVRIQSGCQKASLYIFSFFCWPWDLLVLFLLKTSRAGRHRDTTCHSENACFPFHGTGVWHFLRLTHLAACCETRRRYLFILSSLDVDFWIISDDFASFRPFHPGPQSPKQRPVRWRRTGSFHPKPSAVSAKKCRSGKLLVGKLRLSKGTGERNSTTCTNIWTFRILLFSADVIWWRFVTWDSLPWPTEAVLHTAYRRISYPIPKYTWLTSNNKIYLETSSKVWRVSIFYDVSKHVGVAWWSFLRSTTL